MITERYVLKEYNWAITIIYKYSCSDIPNILDHLNSIGYRQDLLQGNITQRIKYNSKGLIYTNRNNHRIIAIINLANIHKEFDALVTFVCNTIQQSRCD